MPESRDRLSRPSGDVSEIYIRRRMSVGRIGVFPDDSESDLSVDRTPFRWGSTPLTGGGLGSSGTIGGGSGRGLFGSPRSVYRRGGRSQNSPPSVVVGRGGGGFRRGRGGRIGSRSVLPSWYPRTPLGDITHIVQAIERRRGQLGDGGDGLVTGSPTPLRIYQDPAGLDPSPSGAHLEHESLVTPKPKLGIKSFKPSNLGKFPAILVDKANQNAGESELLTPQKKLLNSIDIVEKVVMQELNRLKRTPAAKRAEREKKVRTLMSMR